jgi:hypothetical protein
MPAYVHDSLDSGNTSYMLCECKYGICICIKGAVEWVAFLLRVLEIFGSILRSLLTIPTEFVFFPPQYFLGMC